MTFLSIRTFEVQPWAIDAFVCDAAQAIAGSSAQGASVALWRVLAGAAWGTFELHVLAPDLESWRAIERALDGGDRPGLVAASLDRLSGPVGQRVDQLVAGPEHPITDIRYLGVARSRGRIVRAAEQVGSAMALAGLIERVGGYRSLVSAAYFGDYVTVQHVACHPSLQHLETTWQAAMLDPSYTEILGGGDEEAQNAVPHTVLLERVV